MKDSIEAVNIRDREPSPEEAASAKAAAAVLSKMRAEDGTLNIQTGDHGTVKIVPAIADQLIELLDRVANGSMVGFVPAHSMLTTHQAADILNDSHEYLLKLLEEGEIFHLPPGYLHRVSLVDLMRYKARRSAERVAGIEEFARLGQEWDAA